MGAGPIRRMPEAGRIARGAARDAALSGGGPGEGARMRGNIIRDRAAILPDVAAAPDSLRNPAGRDR